MSHAIVLAFDNHYLLPGTTTIKSILYHNPHEKIYVINTDIPQEWFLTINNSLKPLANQIFDVKIDPGELQNEHSAWKRITSIAFGRLIIPQLIPEDVVLYLDNDLVVNGDLSPLFSLSFDDQKLMYAGQEEDAIRP